jgi:hypothetical protein
MKYQSEHPNWVREARPGPGSGREQDLVVRTPNLDARCDDAPPDYVTPIEGRGLLPAPSRHYVRTHMDMHDIEQRSRFSRPRSFSSAGEAAAGAV